MPLNTFQNFRGTFHNISFKLIYVNGLANGWLLLTVVTKRFILKMTGLLYRTLKCIDKLSSVWVSLVAFCLALPVQSQQQKHSNFPSNMFKINNKDSKTSFLQLLWCFLLLTLNTFCTLVCYNWWIWTNRCQLGQRNNSFRQ